MGQSVRCPKCKASLNLPGVPSSNRVSCANCSAEFAVDAALAGLPAAAEADTQIATRPAERIPEPPDSPIPVLEVVHADTDDMVRRPAMSHKKRRFSPALFILGVVGAPLVVVLLLSMLVVHYLNQTVEESSGKRKDLSNAKPAFSLSAQELFDEYRRNPDQAHKKYGELVVEVSGTIEGFHSLDGNRAKLAFLVEKARWGVNCDFFEVEPWRKAFPGQRVKVKGRCNSPGTRPELVDCVFTEFGENTAVPMTAEELAEEWFADKKRTEQKYKNKFLLLTGTVQEKQRANEYLHRQLTLRGNGKTPVRCAVQFAVPKQLEAIQAGQQIDIIAKFSRVSDLEELSLSEGFLVSLN